MSVRIRSRFLLVPLVLLFGGQGCLNVGGDTAPATVGPAGFFVSSDRGDSWQAISNFPTVEGVKSLQGVNVYRFFTDPQDPHALYWASREHGLFYSYDDGTEWRRAAPPLNAGFVYSVAVHPRDKCTIYAATGDIVYRSDDCSRSWKESYRESRGGVQIRSVAVDPFQPHFVYVLLTNGDLLRSVDYGGSWQVLSRFIGRGEQVVLSPIEPGLIFVVMRDSGLYRSVDNGQIWDRLDETLTEFPRALEYRRFALHPTEPGTLYWISTYGILVSVDFGNSWKPVRLITAPGSADIYGFAVNPKNPKEMYYTTTIVNRSTLYRTDDGGVSWETKKMPSGQIPVLLFVHPEHATLYLGFTIPLQ